MRTAFGMTMRAVAMNRGGGMRHQPASGLRRFAMLPLGGGMETVLVGGVGWHWSALNEQWFFMAGGRALTLGG